MIRFIGCLVVTVLLIVPLQVNRGAQQVGARPHGEPLYPVALNGLCGYMNRLGKIVLKPKFDSCNEHFEDRARFGRGVKYGFIDREGQIIADAIFDNAKDFSDGRAAVRIGLNWGFIDRAGALVIPTQFRYASSFKEGMAVVNVGELWAFIDLSGRIVIGPSSRSPNTFTNGLAVTREKGTDYRFIDRSGKDAFGRSFPFASDFSEGIAIVGTRDDPSNFGFELIDTSGAVITKINPERTTLELRPPFSDGLVVACKPDGSQCGYVDRTGALVIPTRFEYVEPFSEGLAAVEQHGKKGYIDRTGRFVIPPRPLQWAGSFRDGLAMVQVKSLKMGYLDRAGRWVWRPT